MRDLVRPCLISIVIAAPGAIERHGDYVAQLARLETP